MKIGELAHRTNTQVETIRFYEREGLLPEPGRSDQGAWCSLQLGSNRQFAVADCFG